MTPDEPAFQPELFVARDRARTFSRRLRDALTERRLGYQGDRVGMETLVDHADENLVLVLAGVADTVASLDAGRIRDRERGYMEVPLLVASHTVGLCVSAARRIERARVLGETPAEVASRGVLELLETALQRLERYVAAYDEKQPVGPPRLISLERLLERVEALHHLEFPLPQAGGALPAFDRAPPPIRTDDAVLGDLLRAVRSEVIEAAGPWAVTPATPDAPLRLAIGVASAEATELELPTAIERIQQVLVHMHRVEIRVLGRLGTPADEGGLLSVPSDPAPDVVERIELALADEAARGIEAILAAAAGPEAALTTEAEKAVRALLEAPPLPEVGMPPPARLVALLGVLRAVDSELVRAILPRVRTPHCRVAASQVPREKTRKAPIKRDLLLIFEDSFPDFPSHRVDAMTTLAADGKLAAKQVNAIDTAALLAVLGRTWRYAGQDIRGAMKLEPLTDGDVQELIGLLGEIAAIRRDLEAGQAVDPGRLTTLERASIGVLGRLGRLP